MTAQRRPLVPYDSDSSDSDHNASLSPPSHAHRDRPPLLNVNADGAPGQWPVHVSAPVTLPPTLTTAATTLLTRLNTHLSTPLTAIPTDTLHLSLVRSGSWLPRAHLTAWTTACDQAIRLVGAVQLQLGRIAVLTNDTRTRRFLALECTAGHPPLLRLVKRLDAAMADVGRGAFYAVPRLHVSIAWGDPELGDALVAELVRVDRIQVSAGPFSRCIELV
ncbi:hypothetical protein BC828DRAFT_393585 [Blastocladiella britannica]|nr:hypothetical protein BC828DRAFT_393585 [Blastocladiella britannica]